MIDGGIGGGMVVGVCIVCVLLVFVSVVVNMLILVCDMGGFCGLLMCISKLMLVSSMLMCVVVSVIVLVCVVMKYFFICLVMLMLSGMLMICVVFFSECVVCMYVLSVMELGLFDLSVSSCFDSVWVCVCVFL